MWSARGGFGSGDQTGELRGTEDARTWLCKSVGANAIANKANKTRCCQHETSPVGPGEHVCQTGCW